jgi:hypothetical protein
MEPWGFSDKHNVHLGIAVAEDALGAQSGLSAAWQPKGNTGIMSRAWWGWDRPT